MLSVLLPCTKHFRTGHGFRPPAAEAPPDRQARQLSRVTAPWTLEWEWRMWLVWRKWCQRTQWLCSGDVGVACAMWWCGCCWVWVWTLLCSRLTRRMKPPWSTNCREWSPARMRKKAGRSSRRCSWEGSCLEGWREWWPLTSPVNWYPSWKRLALSGFDFSFTGFFSSVFGEGNAEFCFCFLCFLELENRFDNTAKAMEALRRCNIWFWPCACQFVSQIYHQIISLCCEISLPTNYDDFTVMPSLKIYIYTCPQMTLFGYTIGNEKWLNFHPLEWTGSMELTTNVIWIKIEQLWP